MYFCHERRSERNTCHVAINYWYVMIYYVDSIAVYYYICTLLRMYAYTYTRVPRSDMPTTQRTNEISLSHSRSPINHSSFGDLLLIIALFNTKVWYSGRSTQVLKARQHHTRPVSQGATYSNPVFFDPVTLLWPSNVGYKKIAPVDYFRLSNHVIW